MIRRKSESRDERKENTQDHLRRRDDMTNTNETAEPSGASAGSVANPLEQIIRGTVRLHELIEQGRCDSEEADAVRDAMDAPFLALGESERQTARIVSAAIKDRGWIPVTERLPMTSANVLVTEQGEDEQFIGSLEKGRWSCSSTNHTLRVTHWMPLPAPPADGK